MDRDAFLSRVSSSVMATHLPDSPTVPERLPDMEQTDNVALFRTNAVAVDAVVHGPVTRHGVPVAVTGIANGHKCRSFMAWDELPAAGVPAALTSAGLERVDGEVPADDRKQHQIGYRTLDLGVTGVDAGLAESGSLILA
ncbi:MAG: hypothetical protein ACR2NL_02970, partial [Acidimicrobiia bacterium]